MRWIEELLGAVGKTQKDLADALGTKPPRISEMVKGDRRLQAREYGPFADFFGISQGVVVDLISGKKDPAEILALIRARSTGTEVPAVSIAERLSSEQIEWNAVPAPDAPRPPTRQEMPKDVPVFGTVVGGTAEDVADFELNGQIVDYVRRPPRLAGRKDVFAAYVQGSSVSPWREPGQLIYVEGARPPRALDYVLVEFKPHNGDDIRPAMVKRLLGLTPTRIKLRQYTPAKDFEIEAKRVLRMYRVLDWDELMGV